MEVGVDRSEKETERDPENVYTKIDFVGRGKGETEKHTHKKFLYDRRHCFEVCRCRILLSSNN